MLNKLSKYSISSLVYFILAKSDFMKDEDFQGEAGGFIDAFNDAYTCDKDCEVIQYVVKIIKDELDRENPNPLYRGEDFAGNLFKNLAELSSNEGDENHFLAEVKLVYEDNFL